MRRTLAVHVRDELSASKQTEPSTNLRIAFTSIRNIVNLSRNIWLVVGPKKIRRNDITAFLREIFRNSSTDLFSQPFLR